MRIDTPHAELPVLPHRPVRLHGLRGARLQVVAGTCWITVDGDPVDRVLEAGEQWTVDARHPVIVSALQGAARVSLCAPASAARRRPWQALAWPRRPGLGGQGRPGAGITVAA